MTKPFTQKHFGTKGSNTDDSHTMTKPAAAMMKQSAVMSYGSPVQQRKPGETKEQYGTRVFQEAKQRVKTQQENLAKRAEEERTSERPSIRVKMGMGTSLSSTKIKGPRITSGMGTSFTTHTKKIR